VTDADDVAPFRRPRAPGAHKGDFGHVLVMGGAVGKGGAAAMAGLAALRAGAGLVTVAAGDRAAVASAAPELMTEEWGVDAGRFDVIAAGPGLGAGADAAGEVMRLYREAAQPMVLDADGLNALAADPQPEARALRVLTPHPGEMARLAKKTTAEVQADRLEVARAYAREHNVVVVLKGQRTVTAFPEGAAWINPTGTPAMAKAGSGDILTGLIAGLIAQFPGSAREAVVAAVYLHGRAGERAAKAASERTVLATDLLQHLA
jgi:NAD(P)H-hydrate epimerase